MNRSDSGVGDAERGRSENRYADLEALARSLQADPGTSINVPAVVAEGVVVAMIVLSFVYSWPLWTSLVLVVLLGLVMVVSYTRRPPVAPLELTQSERERVRLVLDSHGVRPAISLVRALYPDESPAAAARTVKLLSDRAVAERASQREAAQRDAEEETGGDSKFR